MHTCSQKYEMYSTWDVMKQLSMTYNVIIICHKTIKNVHHTFYPDVLYMIPHVSFEEGSGICFRRIVFFPDTQIHFFPWRIDKSESLICATLQRQGNDFRLVTIMATTKRACIIKRAEGLHQEIVKISCSFLVCFAVLFTPLVSYQVEIKHFI